MSSPGSHPLSERPSRAEHAEPDVSTRSAPPSSLNERDSEPTQDERPSPTRPLSERSESKRPVTTSRPEQTVSTRSAPPSSLNERDNEPTQDERPSPTRPLSERSESKRLADEPESHVTILDDVDARPGSAVSLLRTIVGLYLRHLGGWVSSADLVRLAGDVGIAAPLARTAIARLKQRDLLLAERAAAPGYRLNPDAIRMLERGDRRIFRVRVMDASDDWCLVSYSVPEARRDLRHRLRSRLKWIGAGSVSPGLWILPGHLENESEEILDDLGVRDAAVVFRTSAPRTAGPLAEAVATWWDLPALRAEHLAFQRTLDELPDAATAPGAFAAYVRLIDAWRVLPYLDPGLPAGLLPDDWPGERSFAAFAERSAELCDRAGAHVRSIR